MFDIARLDPLEPGVAEAIHAIQMKAYAIEAGLLGASRFPPLERTVDDVRASSETFLGARRAGLLVGVVGIEPDEEAGQTLIGSLVVLPEWHRRGVGRSLVEAAIAASPEPVVSVSTGAGNGPALALYRALGFLEYRRRFVGADPIEVVKLRRPR